MTAVGVVAALVFLIIVTLIVGVWWVLDGRRALRQRLETSAYQAAPEIVRSAPTGSSASVARILGGSVLYGRLETLTAQSGIRVAPSDMALIILAVAVVGGAVAWLRTGQLLLGLIAALLVGAVPVAYIIYRRQRRLRAFEAQFPESLDMISRAIRAGNALSGAIHLVGEEMPDPAGAEFRQVSEEVRLGMDPSEALARLEDRVPVQDMSFFCTAIKIQRGSGGNLAEILDRLAEVIRERFKILSYARVLSAQHKWSAVFVGLSPIIMALVFQLIQPHYFDALLASSVGPLLITAGIVLEAVGFFMIMKIARIEV